MGNKKKVITEISGGGVVCRKKKSKIEILLLQLDNGRWCLPKGLVEKGENMREVALREVKEETGLKHLEIGEKLGQEHYFYFWKEDNTYHNKFVYYFLVEFTGTEEPKPQKEEGFVRAKWMDIDEALELVKYKETKGVIKKAENLLISRSKQNKLL